MAKLLYTNAKGESVEFSKWSSYFWTGSDSFGALLASRQTAELPFQDGKSPVGEPTFQSLVFRLDFVIRNLQNPPMEGLRKLHGILNPKLGLGILSYIEGDKTRVWEKVHVRQLPQFKNLNNQKKQVLESAVVFEIFHPLLIDPQIIETSLESGLDGFSFPFVIKDDFFFDLRYEEGVPVLNEGDVSCPVDIVFDGPLAAPVEVINVTTGEKVVIALSLMENEQVTVSTAYDHINVLRKDLLTGETQVAFQYIDVSKTTFFQLRPGENVLKITADGSDVGKARARFRLHYVGV